MSFITIDSVDSTMNAARACLAVGEFSFDQVGLATPRGVLANTQTLGRGQRGRGWYDIPGQGLCLTLVITPPDHPAHLGLLAGVAVADALLDFCPELSPVIGLKWPNDLTLRGKKLGGILVEMTPTLQASALVGIGLNLTTASFPVELQHMATSLSLEGFSAPRTEELALEISERVLNLLELHRSEGMKAITKLWRKYDRTQGIGFVSGAITGIAVGIQDDGALLLKSSNGQVVPVYAASSLTAWGEVRH